MIKKLLILLLIPTLTYGQKLQDRAIGIWDFETTAIADSSGNSKTGTITGTVNITNTSPILGNYAEFVGAATSYIEMDDTISLGSKFTINLWTKWGGNTEDYFIGRYYNRTGILINSSGNWAYNIYNNYFNTDDAATTSGWHMVTLTYDSSLVSGNVKFYIDGQLAETDNLSVTEVDASRDWQFGTNGNNSYHLYGNVDGAAMWREVLDATTIEDSLYRSGTPVYSSLWTPDDTPAAPSPDFRIYRGSVFGYPVSSNPSYSGIRFRFHRSDGTYITEPPEEPTLPAADDVYWVSSHPDTAINTTAELQLLVTQLVAGDTVMIEKGSIFRECELDFSNISGDAVNKIVFLTYGSGSKPVITGGKDLSGGFTQSGNIWTYNSVGYTRGLDIHNPAGLLINNQFHSVGKYPDTRPFLTTQSGGSTSITDFPNAEGWGTNTLVNAQVAARVVNWEWYVEEISANSGNSITFDAFPQGMPSSDPYNIWETHYFLQNDERFLSLDGEWAYDDNDLKVYYSSALNLQSVEMPVVDTVINMDYSDYYEFNGIEFRGANKILVNLQNSEDVDFNNCTFRVANVGFDVDYADDCDITNNHFEYLHTNGITLQNTGLTYITDNTFSHVVAERGMASVYDDWSAAVAQENSLAPLYVMYNRFDTIFQAMQTHYNYTTDGGVYFKYNVVNGYGYILGDGGAVYMGGDNYTNVDKVIRSNIFMNAFNTDDLDTQTGSGSGHVDSYTHGVYWDYDVKGALVDSNLFVNANVGIYSNRSSYNSAKYNTFYNAIKDNQSNYSGQIYLDQIIDVGANPIVADTFKYNIHIMGDNSYEKVYVFHEDGDCALSGGCDFNWSNMVFDYNKYQDPFNYTGSGADIVGYMEEYNGAGTHTLAEWQSSSGKDANSSFNPLLWTIDDVPVNASNFVKYVFNDSKATAYVAIDDTATYYDIDGNILSDSIRLGPYQHKIMFYKASQSVPVSRIEEINNLLGQGFNAFGVNAMGANNNNNEWTDGEYWMAGQAGFDNLRLVFYSWDADNETHMTNMVECIDSTLDNGMMAIIDNHWWPWLRDSFETSFNTNVDAWYDNWYKTASWLVNNTTYNSEQIVFELINEPYNTAGVTNGYTRLMDAGDWNTMMDICVDTIRAAAGDSFAIIVAPYHGFFNMERAHANVVWPDDTMLIVTNHYYWPQWATQWGLGSSNYGDWENIQWFRGKINRDFQILKDEDRPVTLGEWGVYKLGSPSTPDSTREKYIWDFHNLADDAGFSWSMWDMNTTNGITTTQGGTTWETDMLAALQADERSVVPIDSTTIYQSDFSSDTDGWGKYENGSSCALVSENNELKVAISSTGSSTLDLRIISPTIPMRQDSIYKVSFTIRWEDTNDDLRTLAGDMDGSWSWVWYEDVPSTGFTRYEVYYQGYSTDLSNNFNFYLGGGEVGTFYISDFKFERATIRY